MLQVCVEGLPVTVSNLFAVNHKGSFTPRRLRVVRLPHKAGLLIDISDGGPVETLRCVSRHPFESAASPLGLQIAPSVPGWYSIHRGAAPVVQIEVVPAAPEAPADALRAQAFGLRPDAPHLQTEALQQLLDTAAAQGGGSIRIPAGRYRTGPLFSSGATRIYLEDGAVIEGSDDPRDYFVASAIRRREALARRNPVGKAALLTFSGGAGGGLFGPGRLDGSGHLLRQHVAGAPKRMLEINLLVAIDCQGLRIEGCGLWNSEFWNTHLIGCQDVAIRRVSVINEIPFRGWNPHVRGIFWNNADGINSDGCSGVLIEDCFIHTGDDCLTLKLTDATLGESAVLEHLVMRRCLLCSSTSAMKIGTETRGVRVEDVLFEDMLVLPSHTGSVATVSIFDHAAVKDVTYRKIQSLADTRFLDVTVRPRRADQTRFGSLRNLCFDTVSVTCAGPSILHGQSEQAPIDGLEFRSVRVAGKPVESIGSLNLQSTPFVYNLSFTP